MIHCFQNCFQFQPALNPTLQAPVSKHLRLKYDTLLSNFAFNINLRCYMMEMHSRGVTHGDIKVGRCRLTL